MNDKHSVAESHNLKFIIPKSRRPPQPGLEVTRYAEDEVSSPQVVEPPPQLLDSTTSSAPSPQVSQRHGDSRGTSGSSRDLPQTADGAASREQSLRSRSSHSRSSQAPIALPYDSSHLAVAVGAKRHLSNLEFEEPPQPPPTSRKQLILGLPVPWFWVLIVTLVVVVAIGLAVGLVVGLSSSYVPVICTLGSRPALN